MTEPFELTVVEAAVQVRERRLSPVTLMESVLSRASAVEPSLKVWVTLNPEAALDAARRSERELERTGPQGPLHGIPVGIKDIYYTKGVRTTAGSPIYAEQWLPEPTLILYTHRERVASIPTALFSVGMIDVKHPGKLREEHDAWIEKAFKHEDIRLNIVSTGTFL